MIKAQAKPIQEIYKMVQGKQRVLIVGCGTCVTVCFAGGENEVALLSTELRMAASVNSEQLEVKQATPKRQCEKEFVKDLKDLVETSDIVVSIACGVGVQVLAEAYPKALVVPGLNTTFMGPPKEQGFWYESCAGCGNCILHYTEGICPIARCAKSILNGPCGGSTAGKCEVSPDIDCAWQLIIDRMKTKGKLDNLKEIVKPKNHSTARDGGQRRIIRKDLLLGNQEN